MEVYDYKIDMCPIAEKDAREVVNLLLCPNTDEKIARRTIDFITRYAQAE